MNSSILLIIALILSIIALIAAIYSVITAGAMRRWRKFFNNQDEYPENLEEIITSIVAKIKTLEAGQEDHDKELDDLRNTLSYTIQNIGLVRFNSQSDEGGNLSFCIALLDNQHSGIVITSLHGRMQNRIYSKQIINGSSEVILSEEEQDAVFAAIKKPQSELIDQPTQKHKLKKQHH
jgi:hypothetical protein